MLIHGEIATRAMSNISRGLSEARIVPIEVLARKQPAHFQTRDT
jgi:hypothetical protein